MHTGTIKTARLVLRPWKEADLEAFVRLNSDPKVMEFLLPMTRDASISCMHAFTKHLQDKGWGLWAVSVPGSSDFIGWIGLHEIGMDLHFTPAVEVAWRLLPEFWGQGYALEGATAALHYGFETLKLDEIVAVTVPANLRSRRLIEKLGMHYDSTGDFDHPKVAEGDPLRRHLLFRMKKSEWIRGKNG